MHAIHIGRRSSQVTQIPFEVWQLYHLFYLFEYALFGTAGYKLALMGRNCTERTPPEASAMDVDRMLDHLVGRCACSYISGEARVCKADRTMHLVQLSSSEGRVGLPLRRIRQRPATIVGRAFCWILPRYGGSFRLRPFCCEGILRDYAARCLHP